MLIILSTTSTTTAVFLLSLWLWRPGPANYLFPLGITLYNLKKNTHILQNICILSWNFPSNTAKLTSFFASFPFYFNHQLYRPGPKELSTDHTPEIYLYIFFFHLFFSNPNNIIWEDRVRAGRPQTVPHSLPKRGCAELPPALLLPSVHLCKQLKSCIFLNPALIFGRHK